MTTSHLRKAALVASSLALVVLSLAAAAAGASDAGAPGAAPVPGSKGLAPHGGYFEPNVAPGATFSGALEVTNFDHQPVTLNAYSVDGLTSQNSGAVYSNEGASLVGAGRWIHFADNTVSLQASSATHLVQTTLGFTVSVPSGTAPGQYLGGLAIQPTTASTPTGKIQVTILTRVVIAVLIDVPGPRAFKLTLGKPKLLLGTDNVGEVQVPLTDTGNAIGKATVQVTLHGPHGYVKTITRQTDTILPGNSILYPVYWPTNLIGSYSISTCAAPLGTNPTGCTRATGSLNSPSSTPSNVAHNQTVVVASSGFPIWLIIVLAVGGSAIVISLVVLVLLRKWRKTLLAVTAARDAGAGPPAT